MPQNRATAFLTAPWRGVKALTQMRFGAQGGGLFGMFMPGSRIDYARAIGDGTRSSVVMAPLRWLQRNFLQAPLQVLRPAGEGAFTPVDMGAQGAGRMLALLDTPNPYYHGGALWKATVLSYVLDGNAYWVKIRNSTGAVVQIWWVPHTLIKPVRDPGSTEFIDYYEMQTGDGMPIRLQINEVVHFRDGIDPDEPTKGMSALRSALREIFTDDEAAQYTASLLKNQGVPGMVVSPDTSAMAAGMSTGHGGNIDDTKKKFEQATTGDNRGRTIVMTGATKIQTFGFNPQEMNLRDVRKIPEERLSGLIGVPAVVCGLGAGLDRSTFANMAEAREAAGEEALIPMYDDMGPTLKHQLLPDFEGDAAQFMQVAFDTTQMRILREDENKTSTRVIAEVSGGLATVKEGREKLGYPVDDSHDVFLRPLQLIEVPAGQTMAQATEGADAGEAVAGTEVDDAEPEPEPDQKMLALFVASAEVKRLSRRQQGLLIQALELQARQLEKAMQSRLEAAFRDLGKHVAGIWATESVKHRKDAVNLSGADLLTAEKVIELANVAKWKREKLSPIYGAQYDLVARETLSTLNATIGLELGEKEDEYSTTVIREGGKQIALVDVEKQTQDAIFSSLADGRAEGMGPVELERLIRERVEGGPSRSVSARATRIARTETMHAQRLSTRSAYQTSGAYTTLIAWDDRLGYGDPDCVARNGEEFSFDQADAEEADEHPNGTLSWAPGATNENV